MAWALVLASVIGTIITIAVFGPSAPRPLAEHAADFATGLLMGAGVYLLGKADGFREYAA
jgi:hypothetical protein